MQWYDWMLWGLGLLFLASIVGAILWAGIDTIGGRVGRRREETIRKVLVEAHSYVRKSYVQVSTCVSCHPKVVDLLPRADAALGTLVDFLGTEERKENDRG